MTEASAPGKLLIAGEYAVLHGAPAIVVAAAARARAAVAPATRGVLEVQPGGARWPYRVAGGTVAWDQPPAAGQGAILESVLAALAARGLGPGDAPLAVRLDSREFHAGTAAGAAKLGLGSSAAVTVALVGALLAHAGATPDPGTVFDLALDAHRRFQSGAGSGADVLCAATGGVVELRAGPSGPAWRRLGWPAGLGVLALWTGTSASTTAMLRRFDAFVAGDARWPALLAALRAAAEAASAAWAAGDAAGVVAALDRGDEALRRLDGDAGIGIHGARHGEFADLARRHGVSYKPSGAGGGDFGLAYAAGAGRLDAVRAAARAAGVLHFDLGLGVPGVEAG